MFLKTAERLVKEQALKDYPQKISVGIPDKSVPQYNYKCHINAAQAVKTGMAVGVVETVVMYDDMCIAHYVSLMADGTIVDFTLGIRMVNTLITQYFIQDGKLSRDEVKSSTFQNKLKFGE